MSLKYVRLIFAPTAALFLLLSTGCYTRQISGLQQDLDQMNRKIHSIKGTKSSKASGNAEKGNLRLEGKIKQYAIQQSDMNQDMGRIRDDLVKLRERVESTPSLVSSSGGSGSGPGMKQLRMRVDENYQRTEGLSKDVRELKGTFESLRTETKELVELLRMEFGADEEFGETTSAATPLETSRAPSVKSSSPKVATVAAAPSLAPSAGSSSGSLSKSHEVNPGENLSTIARKYGVSVDSLRRENNITDPNSVRMGQVIYIP